MDRRAFLRLGGRVLLASGGAAALAAMPGCRSGAPSAHLTPTPTGSPSPIGGPRPPTDADWSAFGQSLEGTLIRPGASEYRVARQLFNPRFDGVKPAGIAFCGSVADVQRSIAFVRDHGLSISPRAGGHSYAGYSTGAGLVCDVSRLSGVVTTGDGAAVIGAGARLIDVYAGLAPHGVAVPAGSCPTVGISGLTLGGGQGIIGRKFGLTSDNLTALQIVTAAGDVLTCGEGEHADLFWASRGGGGGNLCIATSFTFRTHRLTSLTLFFLHWPWPAGHDVVAGWQSWAPHAPDELWSNCHLLSTTDKSGGSFPTVSVGGAYVGSPVGLAPLLQQLQSAVGTAPTSSVVTTHSYLEAMMVEAGCSGMTVAECRLPTQDQRGRLAREASAARSDFFTTSIRASGIQTIMHAIEERQADPRMTTIAGVALDAFGGAINRVPAEATAFVHRDAVFLAQYNATWPESAPAATVAANTKWLDGFYADMRPYASGFAYQNYIDPGLSDWQQAYYGSNFGRLVQVKATYDPDVVFSFDQVIPPS
jgi:FAD/FMN-containing dehydrogenase